MPPLPEGSIRPFLDQSITPTPFEPPGQATVPPVIVSVGLKGGTKTFSTSGSSSQTYTMGQVNREQPGDSQSAASAAAGGGPLDTTCTIHKVRCKNPNDSTMFADVVVVDTILFKGPDGEMQCLKTSGSGVKPYIVDTTGDHGTAGNPDDCSRVSVIERRTNPNDPTQFIDIEILVSFAIFGPDGQEIGFSMPTSGIDAEVVDPTGKVGNINKGGAATRTLYVMEIDALQTPTADVGSTNTEQTNYPTGPIDQSKNTFVEQTFAIATDGTNGEPQGFVFPLPNISNVGNIHDATQYSIGSTGAKIPPDNTDPNPYVIWPKGTKGAWLGPQVPLQQGPLWWIEALNSHHEIHNYEYSYNLIVFDTVRWDFNFATGELFPIGDTIHPSLPDPNTNGWVFSTAPRPPPPPPGQPPTPEQNPVLVYTEQTVLTGHILTGFPTQQVPPGVLLDWGETTVNVSVGSIAESVPFSTPRVFKFFYMGTPPPQAPHNPFLYSDVMEFTIRGGIIDSIFDPAQWIAPKAFGDPYIPDGNGIADFSLSLPFTFVSS